MVLPLPADIWINKNKVVFFWSEIYWMLVQFLLYVYAVSLYFVLKVKPHGDLLSTTSIYHQCDASHSRMFIVVVYNYHCLYIWCKIILVNAWRPSEKKFLCQSSIPPKDHELHTMKCTSFFVTKGSHLGDESPLQSHLLLLNVVMGINIQVLSSQRTKVLFYIF